MRPDEGNLLRGRKALGTIGYIGFGVHEQFCFSLAQLISFCYEYVVPPGHYIHIDHYTQSGQINGRNELVQGMQGDWLLQIDSDHDFEPDTLLRMIQLFEGNNLDVLVGLYTYKQPPYNPVLFQYHDGRYRTILDWDRRSDVKLLPIAAAGAGCLLVRRRVFERIRKEQGAKPFDHMPPCQFDDFNFFERCRVLGIQPYCAPFIEMQHLRTTGVGMSDYDSSQFQAASRILTDAIA